MENPNRHPHITEKVGTLAEVISDRRLETDSTVYRVRRGTRDWLIKVFDHLHAKAKGSLPYLDNPTIRSRISKVLEQYRKDSLRAKRYLNEQDVRFQCLDRVGVEWTIDAEIVPHGVPTSTDRRWQVTRSPRFIPGMDLQNALHRGAAEEDTPAPFAILRQIATDILPDLSETFSEFLGREFTIKPRNVKLDIDPVNHRVHLRITDLVSSIYTSYRDIMEAGGIYGALPLAM